MCKTCTLRVLTIFGNLSTVLFAF